MAILNLQIALPDDCDVEEAKRKVTSILERAADGKELPGAEVAVYTREQRFGRRIRAADDGGVDGTLDNDGIDASVEFPSGLGDEF